MFLKPGSTSAIGSPGLSCTAVSMAHCHSLLSPKYTCCTAGKAPIPLLSPHPPCQVISNSTSKYSRSSFKVAVDKHVPGSYYGRVFRLLKVPCKSLSLCLPALSPTCSWFASWCRTQHGISLQGRYCWAPSSLLCRAGCLLLKANSAVLMFA